MRSSHSKVVRQPAAVAHRRRRRRRRDVVRRRRHRRRKRVGGEERGVGLRELALREARRCGGGGRAPSSRGQGVHRLRRRRRRRRRARRRSPSAGCSACGCSARLFGWGFAPSRGRTACAPRRRCHHFGWASRVEEVAKEASAASAAQSAARRISAEHETAAEFGRGRVAAASSPTAEDCFVAPPPPRTPVAMARMAPWPRRPGPLPKALSTKLTTASTCGRRRSRADAKLYGFRSRASNSCSTARRRRRAAASSPTSRAWARR